MNKKDRRRSKILTAIFASVMLCMLPADAETTVTDESSLRSMLESTAAGTESVKLGDNITFFADSDINLATYKTLSGGDTSSQYTLSGPLSGFNFNVNDGFSIEYLNLKNAQIVNQSNNSTVQLMNSQFNRCSYLIRDNGGVIYNKGGKIISSGNNFVKNWVNVSGGVMFNEQGGEISLTSDNFTENRAKGSFGGAIYNKGSLNISDSTFSVNMADSGEGGAIYSTGNLTISQTTFEENFASMTGGAIYISAPATINNSQFRSNYLTSSGLGGAIYNLSNNLKIEDSIFAENHVEGSSSRGGAIFNDGKATLIAKNSVFSFEYNYAENGNGGAILNAGNLTLSSEGSYFDFLSNSALLGGAIYNAGTVELQNTEFRYNYSDGGKGGAIYNAQNAKMTISNSEFYGNSVNQSSENRGGAIENLSVLIVNNSSFINNNLISGDNLSDLSKGGAIYNKGNAKISESGFLINRIGYNGKSKSQGGAIFNESGKLELINCYFDENEVGYNNLDGVSNGGAIYNNDTSVTATFTADAYSFDFKKNKSNKGDGGAIYNVGVLKLLAINNGNYNFQQNKALEGDGGAIYNSGTVSVANASFRENEADSFGGAILNTGTLDVNGGSFVKNKSNEYGGAIYNTGNASITNVEKFTYNEAKECGGAIYNSGDSTINISGTKFSSNYANEGDGGAIYNLGSGTVNIQDANFNNNHAKNEGGAIYNKGTVNTFATENTLSIKNNDSQSGRGGAILNTNYSSSDANISITANGGDVLFEGNTDSTGSNAVYNESDGYYNANVNLNVRDGNNITFNDIVDGGSINVTKQNININDSYNASVPTSGTVIFNNKIKNNTINICNGKVEISNSENIDASAKINVNGGNLNILGGAISYQGIKFGNNGTLMHNYTVDSQVINDSVLQFTGNGSTAKFISDGSVRNITLGSVNGSNSNTLYVENAKVSLNNNAYLGGTIYEFKNSEINLIDGTGNANNYEFDNIKLDNTKLSFNLKINRDNTANTITTDYIKINNSTGTTQKFDIGTIYINGEENGQRGDYTSVRNLLDGNAELNDMTSSTTIAGATTTWIYKISLDGKQKLKMAIEDYASSSTLNDMNKATGKRFFQFSDGDTRDYHVSSFLDTTAEGEFFVSGNNRNVISGKYTDYTGATQRASLFKLDNNTKLTIDNVTIQDANLVANVNNAVAELKINNSTISANGDVASGAITVQKGKADIVGSAFNNNGHDNLSKGGAIFNQQEGTVNVSNTTFTGNKSKIGGAITNEGNLTISDGTSFSNNIATGTVGGGGAIYNVSTGDVLISSTTFSGNETRNRVGGAIYNKGALNVIGSIFEHNLAVGDDGGAIYNEADTGVKISGSKFNGNNTKGLGGAIYNKGTLLEISDTIFTDNSADYDSGQGGAIYSKTGNLNVSNGTFTGNHSGQLGGAIALESNATISNSSFDGNNTLT